MKPLLLSAAVTALALTACSKSAEPDAMKTDPALTEAASGEAAGMAASPSATATATPSATPTSETGADQAEKTIPAGMRGKWGVNPADCSQTRGDAKGGMTVDATSIRFYESIAEIANVTQRSDTVLKANWAYEGEGMKWKRDMNLTLKDGGKTLVKQEFGADAPQGPYTYKRCG